jgi:hypothetical protein
VTDRIETGSGEQTAMRNVSPLRRTCPSMSDRRVRLPVGHFVGEAWYVVSQCRAYRYRFVRMWDSRKPRLGVVGHSWSVGSEWRTDATVRRCIEFARAWGYGGIDVGNLYGIQPRRLTSAADPIGPNNDQHLAAMRADNDLIVLAWGTQAHPNRAHAVAEMLRNLSDHRGGSLAVLGWTECGQPQHPLRVPKDSTPECLTLGAEGYGLHEAEDPRWGRLLAGET